MGRLRPDHKSIAEFRRLHGEAVTQAGAELVRLAREVGLVRGELVTLDDSKFRTVSSAQRVRERDAIRRYLEQLDAADEPEELVIDPSAVAAALEKLKHDPEPAARFMRTNDGKRPAYNVQIAVDSEHGRSIRSRRSSTTFSDTHAFLLRGVAGAQIETSLATLVYNLKRMRKVMGGCALRAALAS